MSEWYPFVLDAGSSSSDWLTPGRVLRALARGASIASDAVGTMRPLDRGQVEVRVPAALAAGVTTPLPVVLDGAMLTLRRGDDPAVGVDEAVAAEFEGDAPTAGAAATALAKAMGDGFGAEDLGLTLIAGQRMVTQLPPLSSRRLPERVVAGAVELRLSGGKKKP